MNGPWLAAGLLLLGAAGSAEAPEPEPGTFARELPAEVGDVSAFEVVSGEFTSASASGQYRFYVNPGWRALYQLMRYRVRFPGESGATPLEKVVWNRQPGQRVPLLVWERVREREPAEWRVVTPGTAEYRTEMGHLMEILLVHRAARARGTGGEGDR